MILCLSWLSFQSKDSGGYSTYHMLAVKVQILHETNLFFFAVCARMGLVVERSVKFTILPFIFTFKTKLVIFHPKRENPEFSPDMMDGCTLNEASYLEHLYDWSLRIVENVWFHVCSQKVPDSYGYALSLQGSHQIKRNPMKNHMETYQRSWTQWKASAVLWPLLEEKKNYASLYTMGSKLLGKIKRQTSKNLCRWHWMISEMKNWWELWMTEMVRKKGSKGFILGIQID